MDKHISSAQNQTVKRLIQLREKRSVRKKLGVFCVEGSLEVQRALSNNFVLKEFYYCPKYLGQSGDELLASLKDDASVVMTSVEDHVFQKLAVRDNVSGVLAVFEKKTFSLSSLSELNEPLLLMAFENLEKPGNLGASLRSADGAGVSAVVLTGTSVDPYNPNSIRASLGTVFSVPVIECSNQELVDYCKQDSVEVYVAAPDAQDIYFDSDYTKPCCFVMGNEATGVTDFWMNHSDVKKVSIPMQGTADSLNVSVSGALLVYEARKQRLR